MKIELERNLDLAHGNDNVLTFTVKARNPQLVDFSKEDFVIMKYMDEAMVKITKEINKDGLLLDDVRMKIHDIKDQIFQKILTKLKNNIKLDFQPRFHHICQEIYNWLLEHQKEDILKWMQEFNPEKTKYYFDNDPQMKEEKSEHVYENDDDDDDDDEDSTEG